MATQEAQSTVLVSNTLQMDVIGALPNTVQAGLGIDIGLFGVVNPGVPAIEVSGAGYARKTVLFSALQISTSGFTFSNGALIDFAAATGAWTTAYSIKIFPTGLSSPVLGVGQLANPITLANLDVFEFSIGQLVLLAQLINSDPSLV